MSPKIPLPYYQTVFILEDFPSPLPPAFAIVTAFNPMDEALPIEANMTADRSLNALLLAQGRAPFRATGSSPDGSHSEPGWAFTTELDTAVEIARSFNQRALWWIDDGQLYLVECLNPALIPIGQLTDRIVRS